MEGTLTGAITLVHNGVGSNNREEILHIDQIFKTLSDAVSCQDTFLGALSVLVASRGLSAENRLSLSVRKRSIKSAYSKPYGLGELESEMNSL